MGFWELEKKLQKDLRLTSPPREQAVESPDELIAQAARRSDAFCTLVEEHKQENGNSSIERDE